MHNLSQAKCASRAVALLCPANDYEEMEPSKLDNRFLRAWRKAAGLSQMQLSDAIDAAKLLPEFAMDEDVQKMGVAYSTLGRIERGEVVLSLALAKVLASIYGTDRDTLTKYSPEEAKNRKFGTASTLESDPPKSFVGIPLLGEARVAGWESGGVTKMGNYTYLPSDFDFSEQPEAKSLKVSGGAGGKYYPDGSYILFTPTSADDVAEDRHVVVRVWEVEDGEERSMYVLRRRTGVDADLKYFALHDGGQWLPGVGQGHEVLGAIRYKMVITAV